MVYLFEITYNHTAGLYAAEDLNEIEADTLADAQRRLAERISRLWGRDRSQYKTRLLSSRIGRLF